jgi:hypothetical protein
MFAKISLTAAFLLMVAPPIACASSRNAGSRAPMQLPLRMVLAQDSEPALGTSDNDNDSDSNDSADDNQNADSNQTDQQNAAGDDQPIPPTVLGAPASGQPEGEQPEPRQAPGINSYPVNPYQ